MPNGHAGMAAERGPEEWSRLHVGKWLKSIEPLAHLSTTFLAHRVDGPLLLKLDEAAMVSMWIEPPERRRLAKQIASLIAGDRRGGEHGGGAAAHRRGSALERPLDDSSDASARSGSSMATTLPSIHNNDSGRWRWGDIQGGADKKARPSWRPGGTDGSLKLPRDRRKSTSAVGPPKLPKASNEVLEPAALLQALEHLFHDEEAFVRVAAQPREGEGPRSIGLEEWQAVLQSKGVNVIPRAVSKAETVRMFGKAGCTNGRMHRCHFQEGLRLVAVKLGLDLTRMPMPGNWRGGDTKREAELNISTVLASEEGAETVVEKLIVAKNRRDMQHPMSQDTAKKGVGGFKMDYLRSGAEKMRLVREAHEHNDALVAKTKDDLKNRMKALGIRPAKNMRF